MHYAFALYHLAKNDKKTIEIENDFCNNLRLSKGMNEILYKGNEYCSFHLFETCKCHLYS